MDFPALLHSVSYAGTWGQASLTPAGFIDKAAALGFDGVLLMAKRPHVSLLDYGADERRELRARIAARGLRHVAIAGYNNFTADLEHGDVPHLEIQVHYVTELARLAHDLGGGLVRIFTGYENPAAAYTPQWNLVVRAIAECARRAADLGVVIGVQNHHDIGCGFESQYDLIRAVGHPNCKALFDAWAPALHGADLERAARLLAPLTAHTTVANYVRRPRYHYNPELVNYTPQQPVVQAVAIDEGFIDYPKFWYDLAAAGFRGSVAYEMCSPLPEGGAIETLDRYAAKFLEVFHAFRDAAARGTAAG
jgi:sugar phosphate isomerase/epimerase